MFVCMFVCMFVYVHRCVCGRVKALIVAFIQGPLVFRLGDHSLSIIGCHCCLSIIGCHCQYYRPNKSMWSEVCIA